MSGFGRMLGNNLFSIGSNALNSYVQGAISEHWAKKARKENFEYNEKAADAADKRQRAQFDDMYSIGAQMRQLNENNLSPSMLMGGGMPSTQGSTGAQGHGASGITGNPYAGFDPITGAEIELMQAQAENLREKTKTESGENERGKGEISNLFAEGEKMLAEKGNLEFSSEFLKAKTTWQSIENRFAEPFAEKKLSLFDADLQQIIATTNKITQEAKGQELSNKLFEDNFDTYEKQLKANLQKTLAESSMLIARRNESVKNLQLMDAQIEQISQNILQGWRELEIKDADQQAHQAFYEKQARIMLRTLNLNERRFQTEKEWKATEFRLEKRQQNLRFATDLINAYVSSNNALLYSVSNIFSSLSPSTALGGAARSATSVRGFR